MATVASSTRMPTARASPPRVMTLMVWPSTPRMVSEARIDSGIEISTIRVERQEPRKSRIISPVRTAAITASRTTSLMAPETNTDWSNSSVMVMSLGAAARNSGIRPLTVLTTCRVEAVPFFRIDISTARLPSLRTMFCWGGAPSRTKATSRISTGEPFSTLTGIWLSSSIRVGEELGRITNWVSPILARPEGRVRFCALMAVATSIGVRPRACRACRSRSIMIWRGAPP